MSRKAITPVIAVVLLLMMTVAAAGAAFFWMTTIQSRIQGQIGTQVSITTTQTSTSLKIITVICNISGTTDVLNITMQNTGTNTIESGPVAITLMDSRNRVLKVATSTLDSNFDQNEIITLNVDLGSKIMTENKTYGVKVTLPGGIEGTTDCPAQN